MEFVGGFGFAALFYFAAEYEHLTGWKWALASLAVSASVDKLFALSFVLILPAQFGLFCLMVWANVRNKAALEVERAGRREADQRVRQDRVSHARQEADANTDWKEQEAEREAADVAALRERQERVRIAREAREREERDKK